MQRSCWQICLESESGVTAFATGFLLISSPLQVIYRSSLERQMPDAKTVLAKLFSTLQLTEPQFKSVVILFRNKVNDGSAFLSCLDTAQHAASGCQSAMITKRSHYRLSALLHWVAGMLMLKLSPTPGGRPAWLHCLPTQTYLELFIIRRVVRNGQRGIEAAINPGRPAGLPALAATSRRW